MDAPHHQGKPESWNEAHASAMAELDTLPQHVDDLSEHLGTLSAEEPLRAQAMRTAVVEKLSGEQFDAELEHFLTQFASFVDPNPRSMKRLMNGYSVYRDMAILSNIDVWQSVGRRRALARWAILLADAPLLMDELERNPKLVPAIHSNEVTPELLERDDLLEVAKSDRVRRLFLGDTADGVLTYELIKAFRPLRG